jgi:hypothetical protein
VNQCSLVACDSSTYHGAVAVAKYSAQRMRLYCQVAAAMEGTAVAIVRHRRTGSAGIMACCMMRGTCCMLHLVWYMLHCCVLRVAWCMLCVAGCVLCVVSVCSECCMWCVACCEVNVACCVLHVVCCMLHAACCMLCVARCMWRTGSGRPSQRQACRQTAAAGRRRRARRQSECGLHVVGVLCCNLCSHVARRMHTAAVAWGSFLKAQGGWHPIE